MLPLISIVVPAYNAGENVEPTLKSILDQDYGNIEVIFVDDASTDDTAARARRVLGAGARSWRMIEHERNEGVSAARNTGMDAAAGKYLLFMDADDMADPDFLTILHETISRDDSDIAFCGFRSRETATGREESFPVKLDPARKYTPEDFTVMRIFKDIDPTIWTMLFNREFLAAKALRSAKGCTHGQDVEFVIEAFSQAGKIAFSEKCPFIYLLHANMASNADKVFSEKKLRRYVDFTESHFRLAMFLIERTNSRKLADVAGNFILPTAYIKRLTIYAWQGDEKRFKETVASAEVRQSLWSSRKYISKKPEVFMKALCLLATPRLYYWLRSR
ncbi:MAG: glycosyltransferase [Synergistaceae bacterium]|jgi:glycosyltransferase involved in cell wall biosynthesis|nr:glycosyltransferase [Synergistaceae bacterium]